MKSRKDAERVVELSEDRERVHHLAGWLRMAEEVSVCNAEENTAAGYRVVSTKVVFRFVHLIDELHDLVKREAAQQIAAIDKELKQLGVEPDEFEAAAPDAARPLKVVAKSARAS